MTVDGSRGTHLPAIVLGPDPRGILLDPLVGTEGITLYGLERVRTGAIRYKEIEPQGFVAGCETSASAQAAVRISYVHACIEILHFLQLLKIHWVFGVRKDLVNFILEVLIAGWIEEQVVKDGSQCGLDRISACDDGEGTIGEDIRHGRPLSSQIATITLGHGSSVIKD